ncbi:MAG TPA: L-rhamnonate dehydratase [Aestuariivirga sp.]|nr:L-rhamnonate dehydratase [Aestuariivirga sp.]
MLPEPIPFDDVKPLRGRPKIKEVRALVSRADGYGASDMHDTPDTHWILGQTAADQSWNFEDTHPPITNPMSRFPKYSGSRKSWGVANVPSVIVEIENEKGLVGIGLSTGGEAAAFIIEKHLSMFVEGQCASDRSYIWDQLWRASIHYGRKGLALHAISAIDLALWDLYGKEVNEPVYNLMGGRTMERVPVYGTTSRPDIAKTLGFLGAKVPLPYGPSAGVPGMKGNISYMENWRKKVGDDFPLMLDCYMALDVDYAAELAYSLKPYNIRWIEEPLMPDDYAGHAKLGKKFESMRGCASFATGEHEYTQFGFQQLINSGVELLQPDVMWMGGPTEFSKVVALASAQSVALVPHGCGVYGYYMAMAFEHIRMAEFIMMSERADKIEPNFGAMFKSEPLPDCGYIELPAKPGFGLELNREKVNLIRPYDRSR